MEQVFKLLSRVRDSQLVNKYSWLSFSLNFTIIQVLCSMSSNPAAALLPFPSTSLNFTFCGVQINIISKKKQNILHFGNRLDSNIKVPLQLIKVFPQVLAYVKECYVKKIMLCFQNPLPQRKSLVAQGRGFNDQKVRKSMHEIPNQTQYLTTSR